MSYRMRSVVKKKHISPYIIYTDCTCIVIWFSGEFSDPPPPPPPPNKIKQIS